MLGFQSFKPTACIVFEEKDISRLGLEKDKWCHYNFDHFKQLIHNNSFPKKESRTHIILILYLNTLYNNKKELKKWIYEHSEFKFAFLILTKDLNKKISIDFIPDEIIEAIIPENTPSCSIEKIVSNIDAKQRLKNEILSLEMSLGVKQDELQKILQVGKMLSNEKDLDILINQIIKSAISLTSADGGSLYLTEKISDKKKASHLRFKKSSLNLSASEFLLDINKESIAGYAAETGEILMIEDVHNLPPGTAYSFNDEFDRVHNYYTKSMLVVPMKNHLNEITGIIQLINRKRNPKASLTTKEMQTEAVIPFSRESLDLVGALAGQAAVAIENNILIGDIHRLFEGFVRASVKAIEQRDPSTRGHSDRVAKYTVETAKAISEISVPPFDKVHFSKDQIRELRYASLLHDFGKVGVQEKVLTKAKKLYDYELNEIKWRFQYFLEKIEKDFYHRAFKIIKDNPNEYEKQINEEKLNYRNQRKKLKKMLNAIIFSNEPTVLEDGDFDFLHNIAKIKINDKKKTVPLLNENELLRLSVRRGSLDKEERLEIENHVTHSFNFLIQIPWTKDLENIPEIAYGHHEKLDGTGYPRKLTENHIPIQAKIMAIADIYDALTATDRPYKKAISKEKSLDILKEEARNNHIDSKILDIFIQKKIYDIITLTS